MLLGLLVYFIEEPAPLKVATGLFIEVGPEAVAEVEEEGLGLEEVP